MPDVAQTAGTVGLRLLPPADLSSAAAPVWEVLATWLGDQGVLAPVDGPLLVEMCEALGWARTYRAALGKLAAAGGNYDVIAALESVLDEGEAEEIAGALTLASPEAKRLRTAYLECLRSAESLATKFGIPPTERVRLGLGKSNETGSLVELIAGLAAAAAAAGTEPSV